MKSKFLALAALVAACHSTTTYDAKAPAVPFIDQNDPQGHDELYDGSEDCGPAVLAAIAKGHGMSDGRSDAAIVVELAEVMGTGDDGTSGYGMLDGLAFLGFETGANPGCDLDWIDDELAAGHDVVANGDYWA